MSPDDRVVILGGGGFIGSHLAEELVTAGYPVRVFDKTNCYWGNLESILDRVEVCEGDFLNQVDVREALKGCRVVIHLVSTTVPSSSNDNPVYDIEANVVSTLRLLDEARAQQVERILFISSGGTVYGPARELPIAEDHPTEPLCSYAIGKLTIEKYLALYRNLHGLDYHVLRCSNPYGERQNPAAPQGAVAVFLGRVLAGQPVDIWGTGETVRDYLYVKDAVRAFRLVLEKRPPERVFNVGSGQGISINELVGEMRKVTGRDIQVRRKPGRALDVPANVLDTALIRRVAGWSPTVPLAEGLRRTWEWMQAACGSPGGEGGAAPR
jgi:UDP-glucose 4-epimerase